MSEADALVKRLTESERATNHANIRPKDASTLLLLDRAAGGPWRVLMGRRHMRHKFFPGAYVFPGGRVDTGDSRIPVAEDYHPEVMAKLRLAMKGPKTDARARAFGVAAIRETYEEAGLFLGHADGSKAAAPKPLAGDMAAFGERGMGLTLAPLVFVARAITPPRRPRRFDTRFFAAPASIIADKTAEGVGPSGELEDIAWLSFEEAKQQNLPSITLTILDELAERLASSDPWRPDLPAPFYQWRGKGFTRELI